MLVNSNKQTKKNTVVNCLFSKPSNGFNSDIHLSITYLFVHLFTRDVVEKLNSIDNIALNCLSKVELFPFLKMLKRSNEFGPGKALTLPF